MVKHTSTPYDHGDLAREFEKAFYSTVRKSTAFTPPDVLVALTRLLIKPKRISKAIKKSPEMVRYMITGKQKCPVHVWPALYALLRLSVDVARQQVEKAEQQTILWGTVPYPQSVLAMFRTRIKEAEAVLSRADAEVTRAAQEQ